MNLFNHFIKPIFNDSCYFAFSICKIKSRKEKDMGKLVYVLVLVGVLAGVVVHFNDTDVCQQLARQNQGMNR